MIRFLLVTFALTAIMAFAVIAARSIGTHYESPFVAAWKAYRCDPQPCWHGIRPGVTTMDQAALTLKSDQGLMTTNDQGVLRLTIPNAFHGVIEPYENLNVIGDISFDSPDGSATLADLVELFGAPLMAEVCITGGNEILTLFFDGSIQSLITLPELNGLQHATFDESQLIAPTNPVGVLIFNIPPILQRQSDYHVVNLTPWHGFKSIKFYPCVS